MNTPMTAQQVSELVPGYLYSPEYFSRAERRKMDKKMKLGKLFKSMSKQIEQKQLLTNGSLEAETE